MLSHFDSRVCACCRLGFMASIGKILLHTFRAVLGPSLFLSLPFLSLVHFCQHESASCSLYQYTVHIAAGWGEDKRDEEVTCCLSTINNHYWASAVAPFDLFLPVKNVYRLCIAVTLKPACCYVCLCLHMYSKSPLSSDLQFGFNCCVNLSSTLMRCSLLMLLRHITSGLCDAFTLRHLTNLNSNHILITQLHQACMVAANSNSYRSHTLPPVCEADLKEFQKITYTVKLVQTMVSEVDTIRQFNSINILNSSKWD